MVLICQHLGRRFQLVLDVNARFLHHIIAKRVDMIETALLDFLKFLAQENFHGLREAVFIRACHRFIKAETFLDTQVVFSQT